MSEAESTPPKPSLFRRLLKPLLVVFFFLMALGLADTSLLFSILSGFLGLYTIGPINRLVNRSLPKPAVTGPAVYVLFLLAWFYALVLVTDKLDEETAAEFAANREQIIAQATSALEREDYRSVIELADKHLTVNDSELNRLSAEAETALDERAQAEAAKREAEAAIKEAELEQQRAQRETEARQRREREEQELLSLELIPSAVVVDAKYYLISVEKDGEYLKTLHRRTSSSGTGYSVTRIDCASRRYMDLGYGDGSRSNIRMYDSTSWTELVPGSSKSDLVNYVCK